MPLNFTKVSKLLTVHESMIPQVTPQVKSLIFSMLGEMTRLEMQERLRLSDKRNFNNNYLLPAIKLNLVEMTIPDKPKSRNQRYRLTIPGEELKREL
jgi:ATP-dependent DNA helicase RecG